MGLLIRPRSGNIANSLAAGHLLEAGVAANRKRWEKQLPAGGVAMHSQQVPRVHLTVGRIAPAAVVVVVVVRSSVAKLSTKLVEIED